MKRSLTAKLVEHIEAEGNKRLEVRDTLLPGFGLRVAASRKSYFVVGRVAGMQKRVTIGTHPALSLAEARDAARLVIGKMQLGAYDRPSRAAMTFEVVAADFIAKYAKPKNRTWKQAESNLRRFKSLDRMKLTDVERRHVVRVLDDIVAAGTATAANRSLAAVKTMFSWAVDRDIIDINPLTKLKPPRKDATRERTLSDAEITTFLRALGGTFGPMYAMLLLTAQRRGEVTTMRWADIDMMRNVWTIPSHVAKNGKAHEVPLAPGVVELLKELPHLDGANLVFTTNGKSPVSGFSKAKTKLDAAMSISDWRVHDLRRTAASGMARLGIAPHVIEKVLNHSSGQISGVAATYNRHAYLAEKRDALERWADYVGELK